MCFLLHFISKIHAHTQSTQKHISSSSCYKNQCTKRKTTSRSVKRRLKKVRACDAFFSSSSSLRVRRDHVLWSIARAFDHTTRVCFSTRFSPRGDTQTAFARARSFIATLSFSPTRCSRGCLFMYMYHRRPVPAPSHGRLQILRATHRGLQVKKRRGVPFGVSKRENKKTRETRLSFVRRLEMHKIREREKHL